MTGYKSSGYNLDKMELKWLWLDAQAERMNRKETNNESKQYYLYPLIDQIRNYQRLRSRSKVLYPQ